ncbi:MAG TPA: hypothetical protein VFO62_10465 [Candidatus Binatia bacterium]|nr:hypothetical protein [Candidatus Binatia bacterium]
MAPHIEYDSHGLPVPASLAAIAIWAEARLRDSEPHLRARVAEVHAGIQTGGDLALACRSAEGLLTVLRGRTTASEAVE